MITNNAILSGAMALAMGVELAELAEPGDNESEEEAFLRTMASKVYLTLEENDPQYQVLASNNRSQFACYVPAHQPGVGKKSAA